MTASIADAYSETGAAWARGPARIYDRLAEVVLELAAVPVAGRTVVDVGAGLGAGGRAALAAGAAGVVAVDSAFGMLHHDAARRPPAAVADAGALPFADASFGAAVAAFALNHLRHPAAGLREMARVVRRASPVVSASYAADDVHPVKQAVEDALHAAGWVPPAWYVDLRREIVPLLATADGCRRAMEAASLAGTVHHVRVELSGLEPHDLVAWRLGMAQHAPFLAALTPDRRARVAADALARLGPAPPPLVRSILVMSIVTD